MLDLIVSDDGQGIPLEFLPHVFDRFRQADSSVTRQHGGLGIGLAVVKELVDLHGGTLHAHSDGRGKGATFTARFPCVVSDIACDEVEERMPSLTGVSILAVDDNPDSLEVRPYQGRRRWNSGNVTPPTSCCVTSRCPT